MYRLTKKQTSVVTVAIALTLGGCSSGFAPTPESNHPVRVVTEIVSVPIQIRPTTEGRMLREDKVKVNNLISVYLKKGVGDIEISVPVDYSPRRVVQTLSSKVHSNIIERGISSRYVKLIPYKPSGGSGTLIVSVNIKKAVLPQCGFWDGNVGSYSNQINANYGCSVLRNIAGMAVRAEHLVRGADVDGGIARQVIPIVDDYYNNSDNEILQAPEITIPSGGSAGGSGGTTTTTTSTDTTTDTTTDTAATTGDAGT